MKSNFKFSLSIACFLYIFAVNSAYSQKCSVACNITSGYVCPSSNLWKMDPNTYNDAELMADLGYKKTKDGCWTTATLTVQKTGDKSTMSKFYDKVVRLFGPSKVKKTGF